MPSFREGAKKGLRVLLVDDDEDDYIITRDLLSEIPEIDFELDWVGTFTAGLDAALHGGYDLCLVDYGLGERNGLELLRLATEEDCHAPIILLTGQGDHEIDLMAMKAGAADYLIKGHITPPLLERSIRYAVERAQTLDTLKNSESQYRLLFSSNPIPMWLYDLETLRFLSVNDAAIRSYGYRLEEFLASTVEKIYIARDGGSAVDDLTKDVPELGMVTERKHRRKDGSIIDVQATVYEVNFGGRRARLVIAADITDRKRMEDALRRSETHFRSLTENALDLISIISRQGAIQYVSPSSARVIGYDHGELLGRMFFDFIHHDDVEELVAAFDRIAQSPGAAQSISFRFKHSSGKWRTLEAIGNIPPPESGINGIVLNMRDMTERNLLQQQLIQSEKLAALGKLVSGVAHELNNPLTSVLGYTQLILSEPGIDGDLKERLEIVGRQAERARRIVQNMLSFARQHNPTKSDLDLNGLLEATIELRAYELSVNNVNLKREFGSIPAVVGDSQLLQQVFLNVITNAEQAMKSQNRRGCLTVKTEEISREGGRWVRVVISDNGPGIPAEILANVFDPFFTTKGVGEGTGLGLSISYGIVKQHGGEIAVNSDSGKGASFVIELPCKGVESESIPSANKPEDASAATQPSLRK